jgi:hypothetical protein
MPRVPRWTDRVCVGRFRLGLLVTLNGQDRGFVYDVLSDPATGRVDSNHDAKR